MERIEISGVSIAYELLGPEGAPAIALTPGGRFSMTEPGLHELGEALVAGGRRVLLWDRPSCGSSDVCFEGDSESRLHAHMLIKLITALKLGPTALAAGSAGSRVSLIAASFAPDVISHVVVWWVSGGPIGLAQLAAYYCGESATAANMGGMEAVAAAPGWTEQMSRNGERNRKIFLAQDPKKFIQKMQTWAAAYVPPEGSPVPGLSVDDFKRLTMPVLILQNGVSDLSHTRDTTELVHKLIPHSELADPPWPDGEWNERQVTRSEPGRGLFDQWPRLAPTILDFLAR